MIHFFKKTKSQNFSKKGKYKSGYAMLISVIFFTFLSLSIVAGLVSPSVREFKISNDFINSRQSFFLSESGLEDAYYRLKTSKTIGTSESISLSGNTAVTTITDSGYNEKTISSLGDVFLRQRKNEIIVNAGTGINFAYGIQAGTGGFIMKQNAIVDGNVYSNANIVGENNSKIYGSAFAAGISSRIENIEIGQAGVGDAWAHQVKDSTIAGSLYCQIGSNNDGKNCDTSKSDPVVTDLPVTDAMIAGWKADAELGGTISGNVTISSPSVFGPKKIDGNLIINNDLTIAGTLYVTGTITNSNGVNVSLSSSYGNTGGVIVVDGPIKLSNNAVFAGSGSAGSYIMVVTTSICPTNCDPDQYAFDILNNVGAIIVNAQRGTVHLNNNAELNEVVGKTILLDNGVHVNYLSGLANSNFSSGPTGGWDIKSWREK